MAWASQLDRVRGVCWNTETQVSKAGVPAVEGMQPSLLLCSVVEAVVSLPDSRDNHLPMGGTLEDLCRVLKPPESQLHMASPHQLHKQ